MLTFTADFFIYTGLSYTLHTGAVCDAQDHIFLGTEHMTGF